MVLSKEVRKALKFACSRKPSPDPALTTKSTLTSVREPGVSGTGRGEVPKEPELCALAPLFFHPYILSRKGGRGGAMVWTAREVGDLGGGGGGGEDLDGRVVCGAWRNKGRKRPRQVIRS